jgi:Mn-containing catalase
VIQEVLQLSQQTMEAAADDGGGSASVKLSRADMAIAKKVAARTMSDPASDPTTGAELGQAHS